MELIGQAIRHETFGKGIITELNENILTVCFSEGEKRFIYPDAFENFLILKNETMQKKIKAVLKKQSTIETQHLEDIREASSKRLQLENMKISPKSQAAFHVNPSQIESVFSSWSVSTGVYLSGYSKGEPRIPDRLHPNSICLITSVPEHSQENGRQILGAFMVPDDFRGSDCQDGIIHSHEVYKIRMNRPLLFWPYMSNHSEKQHWGKVVFKYFDNEAVPRILQDAIMQSPDDDTRKDLISFYRYFCNINHIIPRPVSEANVSL